MTHQEYVAGLRDLATFYETHPEAIRPYGHQTLEFNLVNEGRTGVESVLRAFGGHWTKETMPWDRESPTSLLYLHGTFGPFALRIYIPQAQVCERVQVGMKTIAALPEQVLPATPEREEPQYEWQCGGLLSEGEGEQ